MGRTGSGRPPGARGAAVAAAPGRRARVLRRAHACRDRAAARGAAGNREDARASGTVEIARDACGGGPMTDAQHDELREASGLYVLGALEGDERAAFEAHLATC